MLTDSEKRHVICVLEERLRLLRDPKARQEMGISNVLNNTVGEMAHDVLTAAGAGDYAAMSQGEHVFVLESFFLDIEDYGNWDPWARCEGSRISALDDGDLAEFLTELARASGPAVSVGAALAAINRHRSRLGMGPLDPSAAGWSNRDVLDEATRIERLPNVAAHLLA